METKQEIKEVIEVKPENVIIPQCCIEGWDSCPHVVQKERKSKRNIGI